VRENRNCSLSYIIPISDNGGSSSELIRIFGGPGIGDVRSKKRHISLSLSHLS
jgi:2-phospho-L-lactate transferase CofD